MTRNSWLKIINPLLAVSFLVQVLSGFFSGHIPYEVFEIVHEGGGIVLLILVILHITLNWNWIKAAFFKKKA